MPVNNNPEFCEEHTLRQRLPALVLQAEALRAGSSPPELSAKGEEKISVFWRVFGGTIISVVALLCVTGYNQVTNNIGELRNDVNRLAESRGDLIKKDEYNGTKTQMWNRIKEVQDGQATFAVLKERHAVLEQQVKAGEEERKQLAKEIQLLRERLATLEGRQAAGTTKPAPRTKTTTPPNQP